MRSRLLEVGPQTAAILHEAYRKIATLPAGDHYRRYDLVRNVMAGITGVDAFYVGLFQGATRVRLPYCYDGQKYDMPEAHTFAPNGPTAWVFREQRTYRYAMDGGKVVRAGLSFGDPRKVSADVVTVPLFRLLEARREIFGVISMHSYKSGVYEDEQVAAFEWLAEVLARSLNRDWEDVRVIGLLPGIEGREVAPLTAERVVDYTVARLDRLRAQLDGAGQRLRTDHPGTAAADVLDEVGHECGSFQADLTEMLLEVDDDSTRRFQGLTEREQAVAVLLADGRSNPEIAEHLSVSAETVKSHLARIREKYGLTERSQLAADISRHLGRSTQRL
ncbi:helix-turn-helix transcriptional regulator [Kribbella pratensis]|uniref:DNA-binding NarL/FixJ family response regulator n=1 Tax=Kribbella pratensis TaxID=2512112 RepID=A0A4R8BXC2_9ACTN|nr:LuxR C-terminal-related transcriptional regulator [Kribbella pratensis]TDW66186.1 DNA-binding NarL/FixJ family response regulator [Kribbella pratensis]